MYHSAIIIGFLYFFMYIYKINHFKSNNKIPGLFRISRTHTKPALMLWYYTGLGHIHSLVPWLYNYCFSKSSGREVQPWLHFTQSKTWFSLVPSDWGIWASPLKTDQDSSSGLLPRYHLILSRPRRASLMVPLPHRADKKFLSSRLIMYSRWLCNLH